MSTYRTIFEIFDNFVKTEELKEIERRGRRERGKKTQGLEVLDDIAGSKLGSPVADHPDWKDLWADIYTLADNDPVATDGEKEEVANLAVAHALTKDISPEEYKKEYVSAPSPKMNDFTSQPGTVSGYVDSLKSILASGENDLAATEDEPEDGDVVPDFDDPRFDGGESEREPESESPSRVSVQNDILDPLSKSYPGVYDHYSNLMRMTGKKVVEPTDGTISTRDLANIIGKIASPEDTEKIVKLATNKKIVAEQALKTYIEIILEKTLRERNKNT